MLIILKKELVNPAKGNLTFLPNVKNFVIIIFHIKFHPYSHADFLLRRFVLPSNHFRIFYKIHEICIEGKKILTKSNKKRM